MSKILDEYTDNSYHSKEYAYFRKVGARALIDNLVDLNRVQNTTLRSADKRLLTRKHSSAIFYTLNYMIDILAVNPATLVYKL